MKIRCVPWSLYSTDARLIFSQSYPGRGTDEEPFLVSWLTNSDDQEDPQSWPTFYKWMVTSFATFCSFSVFFCSSGYASAIPGITAELNVSNEVAILGVSLFVIGFAIGPLFFAPLSEVIGRRQVFILTYFAMVMFNIGSTLSTNIETLLVMRLLAGTFGSSLLTNAGGIVADLFVARQRGIAVALFMGATFMGLVLGPIGCGFVADSGGGWRWILAMMAILTASVFVVGLLFCPETYAPVLLRRRAKNLTSNCAGQIYRSKFEAQAKVTFGYLLRRSITRPWSLLFLEPIVMFLSIYIAIIYGILYMLLAAYPIVYKQNRGWSTGISGLSFCGLAVGMSLAIVYVIFENNRYNRLVKEQENDRLPPETRLPPAIVGAFFIPVGLFWFAWTDQVSIHFLVSMAANIPTGFGMILVMISVFNYLIDSYVIHAASALAANLVLRSIFGAVFPLFTPHMYEKFGIHWAASVPAFLSLICLPFPFIFWKYGVKIRAKSKFTIKSQALLYALVERASTRTFTKLV